MSIADSPQGLRILQSVPACDVNRTYLISPFWKEEETKKFPLQRNLN